MNGEEIYGPDLVVAGAGGGLVAALKAAQMGLSVLVIDANEHFARGNNTSMSTGMIPGAGSRFQREAGIADSPELFLEDISRKTGGDFNRVVAESLAEVSAELVEWLVDYAGLDLSLVTDMSYPGHSADRCHNIPSRSGAAILQSLLQEVSKHELIDVLTPAKLIDVVIEQGKTVGVVIETPAGKEEIPTRALLIATNGYGANKELVAEHIPEMMGAVYFGSEYSLGDALTIGARHDAATGYLDSYQGHAGLAMPAASLATWATVMHGGFVVNSAGKRFGNESSGYSEFSALSLAHAEGKAWIIIDERINDACLVFQDYVDVVNGGGVKWADTIEDLAEITKIDAEGLRATFVSATKAASGEPDSFGRTNWEAPLASRFGAIHVQAALFHTQGGLLVNSNAEVLRSDGNAISGLYASGGAAAGFSGHGAAGYLAGNGLLPAFGLAYIAAVDAASKI